MLKRNSVAKSDYIEGNSLKGGKRLGEMLVNGQIDSEKRKSHVTEW